MDSTKASIVVLAIFFLFLLIGAFWGMHIESTIGNPEDPTGGMGVLVGAGTCGAVGFFVGVVTVVILQIRNN